MGPEEPQATEDFRPWDLMGFVQLNFEGTEIQRGLIAILIRALINLIIKSVCFSFHFIVVFSYDGLYSMFFHKREH